MIINVKKKTDPFARIYNKVLCDKRLSYRARGILAYLLSKPHDWRVMTEDVVNNGTEGRDAIRNCFKELKKFGYAKLTCEPAGGRRWIICEEPGTESLKTRLSGKPEKPDCLKIRYYKDGEEGTKKDPQTPKGVSVEIQADQIAAIFKRRKNTPWSEKEVKAWKILIKKAPLDADELMMIERYYVEARKKSDNICRRDLLTFLNHYHGEVDRARGWCEKHPLKSARKIVHRNDAPTLEAALASRPPEMNAAETKAFCEKFELQYHRLPAGYKRDGDDILFVGSTNGAHAK